MSRPKNIALNIDRAVYTLKRKMEIAVAGHPHLYTIGVILFMSMHCSNLQESSPRGDGAYPHAAVTTDVGRCSFMGR